MFDAKPISFPFVTSNGLDTKRHNNESILHNVPYAQAVGYVMYVMVCMKPNLAYVVSMFRRSMMKPKVVHWKAMKWLFRYIKGAINVGLVYGKHSVVSIKGYYDSSYAKEI